MECHIEWKTVLFIAVLIINDHDNVIRYDTTTSLSVEY